MDYVNLINTAVQSARDARAAASELIAAGNAFDSSEVQEHFTKSERALADANGYKRMQEQERQEREFDASRGRLENAPPQIIRDELTGAIDLTSGPEYLNAFKAWTKRLANPGAFTDEHRAILDRATPLGERPGFQALSITSDGAGGYTVPADRRNEMIRQMAAVSEFLTLVTTIPTSKSEVEFPRVIPNATSGFEDIYTSAGVGTMVGEQPSTTAGQNEQAFGQFKFPIKRGRYQSRPTLDLIEDTDFDIDTFLLGDAAENMALQREQQILVGTGIGANVRGVVNNIDLAAGTDISGTTADQISNTTSDAGSAPKLWTFLYSVPAQYRRLPSFRIVMNSDTEMRVRKLVDFNGQFLWAPGFSGTPDTLMGKPTLISEFMASGGTDGNIVMFAGPLALIIMAVRKNLTPQILLERFADTDQVGLFVRQRFGGDISNPRAFKLGIV